MRIKEVFQLSEGLLKWDAEAGVRHVVSFLARDALLIPRKSQVEGSHTKSELFRYRVFLGLHEAFELGWNEIFELISSAIMTGRQDQVPKLGYRDP